MGEIAKDISKARVLIVEDEVLLLQLVQTIFRRSGIEAQGAVNGVEALEKISKEAFDLVLTDIQMPKMTGVELCHRVKSDETIPQPGTWLALTAFAVEDLRGRYSLARFDEVYYKPINPNLLAQNVVKRLNDAGFVG